MWLVLHLLFPQLLQHQKTSSSFQSLPLALWATGQLHPLLQTMQCTVKKHLDLPTTPRVWLIKLLYTSLTLNPSHRTHAMSKPLLIMKKEMPPTTAQVQQMKQVPVKARQTHCTCTCIYFVQSNISVHETNQTWKGGVRKRMLITWPD